MVSNLHKKERGVDRTVFNLLHAIPDAEEYQGDLRAHCENASRFLGEWMDATRKQQSAYQALRVELDLIHNLIGVGDKAVRQWKEDITDGAHDLGLLMPRLGFRVIKDIPEVPA